MSYEDSGVGEEICLLQTAGLPLVMRRINDHNGLVTCKRIGTAYVHGIMDGEAWLQGEKYPLRTYRVV